MRRGLLAVPAMLLAATSGGFAQAPTPLQRANQLIASGKSLEAIPILDSLTRASPELPVGWNLLGAALLTTRQLDRAVEVLERAATFERIRPVALYNLGLAYGLQGDLARAFALLQEAKATGRMDMTRLGSDSDAGPIRADPRYATLLPTPEEYASPFAEGVPLLREWRGDAPGDQFGWVARDVGDVDGDGVHDIVTSAPTSRGGGGDVYLLSTAKGTRLWSVHGSGNEQLGTFVEAAGDVDGDGLLDVVAGAPNGDYVLVLAGRDGRVIRRIDGRQPGEQFGQRVADIGDVNGDGHADLLIGAPLNDQAGEDAGRVYLVSGRTGTDLASFSGAPGEQLGNALAGWSGKGRSWIVAGASGASRGGRAHVFRDLATTPAFTIEPDSTGVALGGMFASILGDLDGDGAPEVYVTDWSNAASGPATGRAYLHSGGTGARLATLTGEGPGNGFGIGAADAGDLDKDGVDDLVIGAWIFPGAAANGGKIYLYSGRTRQLLGTLTGRVMGETLGFDTTGLGDVDGDGVPDLLLTSAWSGINGTRSGRVLVVSGAAVIGKAPARSP